MKKTITSVLLTCLLAAFPSTIVSSQGMTSPQEDSLYVVRDGDSLGKIALKMFGDSTLWEKIWKDNPSLHNPHRIFPRQIIRLPQKNDTPVADNKQPVNNDEPRLNSSENIISVTNIPDSLYRSTDESDLPYKSSAINMLINSFINDIKNSGDMEQADPLAGPPDTYHLPVFSLVFSAGTDTTQPRKYLVGDSLVLAIQGDRLINESERPKVSSNCDLARKVAEYIETRGKFLNGKKAGPDWLVYTKWMVIKDNQRVYAFLLTNVNEQAKGFILLKEPVDVLRVRIFSDEGYIYFTDKGIQGIPGYFYAADSLNEQIQVSLTDLILREKYQKALTLFIQSTTGNTNGDNHIPRKKLNRIF